MLRLLLIMIRTTAHCTFFKILILDQFSCESVKRKLTSWGSGSRISVTFCGKRNLGGRAAFGTDHSFLRQFAYSPAGKVNLYESKENVRMELTVCCEILEHFFCGYSGK